ncbi:MAG: acylphosphatase [Cyanobacteria bacterium HKST-UBA06]|nr:acylphosphatase [Cyanobacteria bacterium HKST-UBA06]
MTFDSPADPHVWDPRSHADPSLPPIDGLNGLKGCHCLISGVVQGVWYRVSLQEVAQSNGVAGWCRNMPDGRVEAFLVGPAGAIEAVLAWCRTGPEHARVAGVEVTAATDAWQLHDAPEPFEIRR